MARHRATTRLLWSMSLGSIAVAVGCSLGFDGDDLAQRSPSGGGAGGGGGGSGVAGVGGGGVSGSGGQAGAELGGGPAKGGRGGEAAFAGSSGAAGDGPGASGGTGGTTLSTKCPGGTADECNDGNPCTIDACIEGVCIASAVLPGSSCDTDTDKCNGTGTCQGTACKIDPKTVVDPTDTDKCTDDVCDPATGIVTHPPKVKPSDSTVCTETVCDPLTGSKIARDKANDGDACTFDECSLDVGPVNTPKPIGDGDPCTVDSCDPITGVKHEKQVPCLGCTGDESCIDDNPCTADKCVDKACVHTVLDGTSCDNGTVCDGIGVCKKGICDKGVPVAIDDANPCTTDSCDPVTGVKHVPVDVDDKNACTTDSCNPSAAPADAITHTFIALGDGDPCTVDTCFPATGVLHAPVPGCKACATIADCPQGKCLSSLCTAGPEGSVCNTGNLQLGTPCGDGQVCNGSESCDGTGSCVAGAPPPVDDGNACTIDSCVEPTGVKHEPTAACKACTIVADCDVPPDVCFVRDCVAGKCTTKPAPTGVSCSNGLKCDGVETCDGGVCKKGPVPDCGVTTCQGQSFVSPTCSQGAPAANGCGTVVQDCGAQNKVCSVGSNGCVGCDNTFNKCETGKVCNTTGPAPHLCCTPQSTAVTCGLRVCGQVVDNCGVAVNCGICVAPNPVCNGMGQCTP